MSLISVMQQKGLWRSFEEQVVGLEPVLLDMSERGMPVQPATYAQVKKILTDNMATAKATMQQIVPDAVRLELKLRVSYKRAPRKVTAAHFQIDGQWYRWKIWSPSNKGLLAYIRYKGHPVPTDYKSKKETTKALEIMRLSRATQDPLYKAVIDYRKAQTILKNHMKNWVPGDDGRVHTTFYFDPATGQLSSRRPNTQNAPKRDDPEFGGYANTFRTMIEARPGHVLVEFDFKSFHAQTLAFEAEDRDYLRLAKLDIHSFLAARLIREPRAEVCLSWSDTELAEYLAWIKANYKFIRDEKAKRAILGYGFGMGWKKLYDMNRESFDDQKDAKRTLAVLDETFPIAKRWRDTIRQQAHEQGYLTSRYGYIRYFWEVMRWKGGTWSNGGEDSEAAIAFLPANDAFGHMRYCMLQIRRLGLDARYGLINNVHDSLVFECPESLLDEAMQVKVIMEEPSKVLVNSICPNGLAVEVDVQVGRNWASYNKKKPTENPGGLRDYKDWNKQ
jgi:hypothetical protein